mmetsp:Transcript_55423/g.129764  ORF Transcript_55423/g.129764 Transcript_55423/m.129764 type:complete len:317 (-) Transcript_55423:289-1239(-)
MHVTDNLHLNVASPLAKLHHEHRRPWHFSQDLRVVSFQLLLIGRHSDAFASTTFRGLQHHWVADPLSTRLGLFKGVDQALLENLIWDCPLLCKVGLQAISTPWDRVHACCLSQDVRCDLVTQHGHHRTRGANEGNAHLCQRHWQLWILGRMTPSRPDRVNFLLLCDFADQVHVGVIVRVLTTWDFNISVCEADEFGIRIQVIGGGHGYELKAPIKAQLHICPLSHRQHGFSCRHAVVGDENTAQRAVAPILLNVVCQHLLCSSGCACLLQSSNTHLDDVCTSASTTLLLTTSCAHPLRGNGRRKEASTSRSCHEGG